jgi:hypothetical protein
MLWSVRNRRSLIWLGLGLLLGVAVAGFWPHTPLHAVATDRAETFAIATGQLDEQVEAVYFLDFLTGDLRGMALGKMGGKFNAFFGPQNVGADLGVDQSKNPRYLLATGFADLRRGAGAGPSPSRGVIYVAEITTGRIAAYSSPWQAGAFNAARMIKVPFALLDMKPFRTAAAPVAAPAAK